MNDYNPNPKTLDELISQAQLWDGEVQKVEPVFGYNDVQPGEHSPAFLISVILHVKPYPENEMVMRELGFDPEQFEPIVWIQHWNFYGGSWKIATEGSDPSTNGGSVMTGRS